MSKQLKSQVESVLQSNEQSRNSDIYLTILIWTIYYPQYIKSNSVYLEDLYNLPSQDNIKRIRADFQNSKELYLPTSIEVVHQRRINENRWRELMGYPISNTKFVDFINVASKKANKKFNVGQNKLL